VNSFQILGLLACAAFIGVTVLRLARHRLGIASGIGWIGLWAAAAVAIAYPDVTVWLAGILGIQRGADLVFYVAILAGLAGFYLVLSRLRRFERELTLLTRSLALHESPPPRPDAEPDRAAAEHR
jgi:hypothetical protein